MSRKKSFNELFTTNAKGNIISRNSIPVHPGQLTKAGQREYAKAMQARAERIHKAHRGVS